MHIDGEVDAEINSTGIVKIGETGIVNSDLRARSLVVTGKFFGNADCETIELVAGGEAEGKLTSNSLTIDANSSFQGESIRKDSASSPNIVKISNDKKSDKDSDDSEKDSPFSMAD